LRIAAASGVAIAPRSVKAAVVRTISLMEIARKKYGFERKGKLLVLAVVGETTAMLSVLSGAIYRKRLM
jgi:hypothetical protein